MGITRSTVRTRRFPLQEPERLAPVDRLRPAVTIDERYALTQDELLNSTHGFCPDGAEGPLKESPSKEKRKPIVLMQLARRFDPDRRDTEPEVNAVLNAAWHDQAILRRDLIE